jgi:hypothetical protein
MTTVCIHDGCTELAEFGMGLKVHCREHKLEFEKNGFQDLCPRVGCNNDRSSGRRLCKDHSTACTIPYCNDKISILYGNGLHCKTHATISSTRVHQTCCRPDCRHLGKFSINGEYYCKFHRVGLFDVSKPCESNSCQNKAKLIDAHGKTWCTRHYPSENRRVLCDNGVCMNIARCVTSDQKCFCKKHEPIEYLRKVNRFCIHEGCFTSGHFTDPSSKNAYCKQHIPSANFTGSGRFCVYNNCSKRASLESNDGQFYCSAHCPIERRVPNSCRIQDCPVRAKYGSPMARYSERCFEHKLSNDVLIRRSSCNFRDCDKPPNYGDPASRVATHCWSHKGTNQIIMERRRCSDGDCIGRADFGHTTTRIKERCHLHKRDSDILLTNFKHILNREYCTVID